MEKIRGFIFILISLAGTCHSLPAATTIRDDSTGIVVFQKKGSESLDKPVVFQHLTADQAYYDVVTPASMLMHIETDRVVKIVFFLNPATFPTKFGPEDLAALKAKIGELRALGPISSDAAKLAASHMQYLQNVYDTESARYKQSTEIAAQQFTSDLEKAAFEKKCDLLKLDLQASTADLKHSEQIIGEMEPLSSRSQMLTDLLAKWNLEKNRALQLSSECSQLWAEALKAHPQNFKPVTDLKDVPDFPADIKEKFADLQAQFDQFRNSVTLPQTLFYCKDEIPAVFLLNQMPDMVEAIKSLKYQDAGAVAQKALQQLRPEQIVDTYKPVYTTFKSYSDLVEDVRTRFSRQLAKAKASEGSFTNREVLIEYQKAYDIIPDSAVASKILQLKQKIKEQ